MCLAIPGEITELLSGDRAVVSIGGVTKDISLVLLETKVAVGDYVIIHVGFALTKLDKEEALTTLGLFQQMLDV